MGLFGVADVCPARSFLSQTSYLGRTSGNYNSCHSHRQKGLKQGKTGSGKKVFSIFIIYSFGINCPDAAMNCVEAGVL